MHNTWLLHTLTNVYIRMTSLDGTPLNLTCHLQAVFNWMHLARAQLGRLTDDIDYDFGAAARDAIAVPGTLHAAAGAAPAGLGGEPQAGAVGPLVSLRDTS
jgi:hypothetical protein